MTRQVPSLLGLAFGAVAVRVFIPEYSVSFHEYLPRAINERYEDYVDNFLSGCFLYTGVYVIVTFFCGVLKGALSVLGIGMLNRIVGSLFSLLKNLLWLSLLFNLMLCNDPESKLLEYEKSGDGNIVAGVLDLTEIVTGLQSAEYFAHLVQLKDAATIS